MKKNYWLLLLLFLPALLKAQVTLNVQLPPGGMIQKDQLWNMVIINNNAEMPEATVSLDLQDAATGQTVMSAGSRIFVLGKGVKVISPKDVQPIQYNYLSAELSGNYIPLGTYVACFRVVNNTVKGPQPVGDECLKIHINPLSPPLLTTPADRSVLETTYPQFSWMPPAPAELFSNLNYDIMVTEMLPGQSAAEAVLYNTPVYTNHNLRVPFESYPSSFSALKKDQAYAWQVVARNGFNYAVQTETWSFVIKSSDSVSVPVSGDGYVLLRQKNDAAGMSVISNGMLRMKYYSFDKAQKTTIQLRSESGELVSESVQELVYGDNFLTINLSKKFAPGKVYTAELKDSRGNLYGARFMIKENNQN